MKNKKAVVLILLLLSAFADGVAHWITAPGEIFAPSDMAFTIVGTLLIFLWYRFDSDEIGYRRTPLLNIAMVAAAILALPYYFFRSRGFKQGSFAVGLLLACVVIYFVIQTAGEYAAYYVLQS